MSPTETPSNLDPKEAGFTAKEDLSSSKYLTYKQRAI
jgi:hypothetical protein